MQLFLISANLPLLTTYYAFERINYSRFTGDDKLVTQEKGEGIKFLHADTEDPGVHRPTIFCPTSLKRNANTGNHIPQHVE